MPRDEWKRANDRAKYGPVRPMDKQRKQRSPKRRKRHTGFVVPVGMLVSVCKVDDVNRRWKPHRMRKRLKFREEYKTRECRGSSGAVIFRYKEYLILTRRDKCKPNNG